MAWLKNILGEQPPDPLREAKHAEQAGDWREAGFIYEQMGDLQNALERYKKARDYAMCADLSLRLDRTDLAVKFFLLDGDKVRAAELLNQLGEHERAAELFVETGSFTEAAKGFMEKGEYVRAAEIYSQGGLHEEAGAAFEKAGQDLPAAEAYLAGHHYTKAAAAFERVGEFARAGKVYEKSGRSVQAGAAFEEAGELLLAALAYKSQITEAGVEARYLAGGQRDQRRELSIRAARCFEKTGKLKEAAQVLEEAGEYMPAAEIAAKLGEYRRAAELFKEVGETSRAVEMYKQAGDERSAASLSGEHELSLGNEESAAESFLHSGDHVRAAEIFAGLGKWERAADCYEAVEAYAEAADAAIRAGAKARAAAFLEKANDLEKAAKLYAEAGDSKRAMRLFGESGRFFEAAQAARDLSEEKMVEFLQRVEPGDENYRRAVEELARKLIARGWGSLAVEKLDSLLAGQPVRVEDLHLWDLLSQAYESQGDLKIAADLLHRMLGVQHNYKDIGSRHCGLVDQIKEQEQREVAFRDLGASQGGERYELQDLLGEGGMGAVYRAFDNLLKRAVAYKILSDRLAGRPDARRQLLEEARAAAALNHPNIITVHDIGFADQKTFICMELIEGESYASLLAKKKRLQIAEAMHLLVSVCQGLDHAHHRGIVHRDLKPSNLLLTVENRVKIVDFGLSMPIHQGNGEGGEGLVAGTPKYIAPEQARGEPSDARSDIYSLGASLYELLLGTPPFVEGDLIQHHLNTPVPPIRTRGVEVPPPLDELLLLSMAKDPSERFQSAGEMISFASAAGLL
jgi:tetratricopeptide (TPR) repeat protein